MRIILKIIIASGIFCAVLGVARAESTDLYHAACNGNLAEINRLLDKDPTLVSQPLEEHGKPDSTEGETPLHFAAWSGEKEAAALLLRRGADINSTGKCGRTALFEAAQAGKADLVKLLLENKADVSKGPYDVTPIQVALMNDHRDIADILLAAGAPVDIFVAAGLGDVAKVSEFLDKDHQLAAAVDRRNRTPLLYAAAGGSAAMVDLLLAKGVPLASTNEWMTPLHFAAQHGHAEAARALLKHHADPMARDFCDWTPLQRASNKEVAEVLIAGGADPTAYGDGETPLHLAAMFGRRDVVEVLIAHKANVNAKIGPRTTPQYNAAPWLSSPVRSNPTPLYGAVYEGHSSIVELLLKNGATITATDEQGKPVLAIALDYAKWSSEHGTLKEREERAAIVELLKKYGASETPEKARE